MSVPKVTALSQHRFFFGALSRDNLPLVPPSMRNLPAGRRLLQKATSASGTRRCGAGAIGAELVRESALAVTTE